MKKHPYVAVMEAIKESLNGEAMRLFKMKVESIKNKEDQMKKVIIDGIEYVPVEKPKALLADAKVGDLCKLGNGKHTQIAKIEDGIFKYQDPDEKFENGLYWCDITGNTDKWGKVEDFDIIHTEPLAPEGSAEWAWQMLNLLGLPIYHPAEGVLTIPIPYSSERFAHCYAKTGWLIHKPVSESPKLKPCPFCGGEVKMYKEEFDYGRFAKVIIEHCKNEEQETCIRMSYLTAEEAIRHWNKRETDA